MVLIYCGDLYINIQAEVHSCADLLGAVKYATEVRTEYIVRDELQCKLNYELV